MRLRRPQWPFDPRDVPAVTEQQIRDFLAALPTTAAEVIVEPDEDRVGDGVRIRIVPRSEAASAIELTAGPGDEVVDVYFGRNSRLELEVPVNGYHTFGTSYIDDLNRLLKIVVVDGFTERVHLDAHGRVVKSVASYGDGRGRLLSQVTSLGRGGLERGQVETAHYEPYS